MSDGATPTLNLNVLKRDVDKCECLARSLANCTYLIIRSRPFTVPWPKSTLILHKAASSPPKAGGQVGWWTDFQSSNLWTVETQLVLSPSLGTLKLNRQSIFRGLVPCLEQINAQFGLKLNLFWKWQILMTTLKCHHYNIICGWLNLFWKWQMLMTTLKCHC